MNLLGTTTTIMIVLQLGLCLAKEEENVLSLLTDRDVSGRQDGAPLERVVRSVYPGDGADHADIVQRALANLEYRLLHEDRRPADDFLPRLAKRKSAFWQPMGGPLPVETRFVSFGGQTEGEDNDQLPAGVIRAMRYGRRR